MNHDDRKLGKHLQAANQALTVQITSLKAQLFEARQLVVVQRQQIQQEKQLIDKFEQKIEEFRKYQEDPAQARQNHQSALQSTQPSLFQTKITAELLQRHIAAKSSKSRAATFLTQENKIDAVKMQYEAILKQQQEHRRELAVKKSDRNAILLEILGKTAYDDFILFEQINSEESQNFQVLRTNLQDNSQLLENLKADFALQTRELAINRRALALSKQRFELIERQVARLGQTITVANLLFNPNAVDMSWISTEGQSQKRQMLQYCLKLAQHRRDTEQSQLQKIQDMTKPIRSLLQGIIANIEQRGTVNCMVDKKDADFVFQQLQLNKMQILEVLKYGGLTEADFS